MSYEAIVAVIDEIKPIVNADRIVCALVLGNSVVVNNDYKKGDIVIFCPCDGILEDEFCEKNDLFPRINESGKRIGGGFFTKGHARVRSQRFRGSRSEGFAFPISYLEYTGFDLSKLRIGDKFSELNGVKICSKYINPATFKALNERKRGKKQPVAPLFFEHKDTDQFDYYSKEIPVGALITLSNKSHGCVSANTLIETLEWGKLTIKEIVDNRLKVKIKAFDISSQEIVWVNVDQYFYIPNEGEWYEIELDDGTKLEITSENPVWLPELDCYRQVDKLILGDNVLLT